MSKKVALIILDGFGITSEKTGNAVLNAKKPYFDEMVKKYPSCLLKASAEEVGLPWGESGNSEVGHTNIGLGRVVLQDLPQIDKVLDENKLGTKENIIEAKNTLSANPANLHLIFLASDGAVHGHIRHVRPIIDYFLNNSRVKRIVLHLISDGRDVNKKSVEKYISMISEFTSDKVSIGSISGRYFAMDRDKNYERTAKAYQAILGQGERRAQSIDDAVKDAYGNSESDEFITPTIVGELEKPDLDRDLFIFTNYRADRAIQLARAFCDGTLKDINSGFTSKHFYTMTTYDDNLGAKVLFSNLDLYDEKSNPLSSSMCEILAKNGLTQHHIAETEKFAHVTYFLSGGVKDPFEQQENFLIPSEKLKSYDLAPKMKAEEITTQILKSAEQETNLIVANYANGDMVGHSGNYLKSIEAVEFLDFCLKKAVVTLAGNGYDVVITADHGNCDEMVDLKNNKPSKEHSLNPVPFILVRNQDSQSTIEPQDDLSFYTREPIGVLADVAPTLLDLFEIEKPSEFEGMSLISSLSK